MIAPGYQCATSPQLLPDSVTYFRFKTKNFYHDVAPHHKFSSRIISWIPILNNPSLVTLTSPSTQHLALITRCKNRSLTDSDGDGGDDALKKFQKPQQVNKETQEKSFWAAVGLIIGTAVGPGMLGLPAATIKSGPLPSTVAIILSWIYVVSSILLVAELSFVVMEEDNLPEVSFTLLATKTLGNRLGSFVALVYASLSFSLLVACVSGIGSIVSQWFPWMYPAVAHAVFPSVVGIVLCSFPFKAIDAANRFLCCIMLFSITALVAIGLFVGRTNILSSFTHASWGLSSILPAIPVTVLTLGFHVITPFVCTIAGNTVTEARKAILSGGLVPLLMVLSWNSIVLGLAGTNTASSSNDPISLLLSVNSSALTAIQGFAFTALATSLIGYAVSFPKQVVDTLELIFGSVGSKQHSCYESTGNAGEISDTSASELKSVNGFRPLQSIVMPLVLGVSVVIASFFSSTFSRSLDFAGVYANCFLFGILPPVMAYIYRSKKKRRSSILPGGDGALLLLFSIAVVLSIWH
ncbi:hypothetical protein RJ639_010832 [Escallonia herrerae]|uniref:Tyrosine-specific transport protein n=1 Tax=Escallonia herrerae TaxID=1293975 RepID=A0AA88VQE0_9ASTE|nr:hypothetical protein RJ639_010832 [Escallonia herrerae]